MGGGGKESYEEDVFEKHQEREEQFAGFSVESETQLVFSVQNDQRQDSGGKSLNQPNLQQELWLMIKLSTVGNS